MRRSFYSPEDSHLPEHLQQPPEYNQLSEYSERSPESERIPEHTWPIREPDPFSEETAGQQAQEDDRRQKRRDELWHRLLSSAFRGGAAAAAILAAAVILAVSVGHAYGESSTLLSQAAEPLQKPAVTTQTSPRARDFAGLWKGDPEAPHQYGEAVLLKEGSCLEEAELLYPCNECGISYSVKNGLGEHTPGELLEENRTESGCLKESHYDEVCYCSLCHTELSRTTVTVPAIGQHSPGEAVQENLLPATCQEEGSRDDVIYCSVCGEELSRDKVLLEIIPHEPGEIILENEIEVSCSQEGSYEEVQYCVFCGEELSRELFTVEPLPHTEGPTVQENLKNAGCTTGGSRQDVVYCSVCGEELSRRTVSTSGPLGHSFGNTAALSWIQYAPTCTRCGANGMSASVSGSTIRGSINDELMNTLKDRGYRNFTWIIIEDYSERFGTDRQYNYSGSNSFSMTFDSLENMSDYLRVGLHISSGGSDNGLIITSPRVRNPQK